MKKQKTTFKSVAEYAESRNIKRQYVNRVLTAYQKLTEDPEATEGQISRKLGLLDEVVRAERVGRAWVLEVADSN